MKIWTISRFEIRTITRQRFFYTFLLLWTIVLSLILLMQQNITSLGDYTNLIGTMFTLILYLLPLTTLILSSFSLTNERESGQWKLLLSYPLSSWDYLIGKFLGQLISQWIILTFSLGFGICLSLLFGHVISFTWALSLYLFALLLLVLFLIIGIFLGVVSKTRWQALMLSIAVWFIFIMIWPITLISILSFLPYPMIETGMTILLFLNPAEFVRVFMVVQLEGGAIFGQTYDSLFQSLQSWFGWLIMLVYLLVYTVVLAFLTYWQMERNKKHG